jgi:hypothetical protein
MGSCKSWVTGILLIASLGAQVPPEKPVPAEPPVFWPERPQRHGHPGRTVEMTEPLSSGSKLWIKNRNGSIRIEGWDQEKLFLHAQIRDSERRKVHISIQRKADGLEVDTRFQQPSWSLSFGFVPSPMCEMTLKVPRKLLGHFTTRNGGVFVANLEGFVRCETTNGDIRVHDISGEVWADTTNGTIEARDLKARIKGTTNTGGLVLENVEGGVHMSTTTGYIMAKNLDGWGEGISLATTTGNIEVTLGKAAGELTAQNATGAIDMKLPKCQVIESNRHILKVKIPGKQQKITLETATGDIRVRQ